MPLFLSCEIAHSSRDFALSLLYNVSESEGCQLLKWDYSTPEEEPFRLPKSLSWIALAVYIGAFSFVILTWVRWFFLIKQFEQTFYYWGN